MRLGDWGRMVFAFSLTVTQLSGAEDKEDSRCAAALASHSVCEAANKHALEIMNAGHLEAILLVQDVQTGGLIAFAASNPAQLDVTTALPPLSPVKLMAAAAWLDATFWRQLAPRWQTNLVPAASYHSLDSETSTKDWEDTLSIGEERIVTTALHLSRFLQAVGNGGRMLMPTARDLESKEQPGSTSPATTVMSESAALKLQEVMRGTVERGTAKSAKPILAGTG